MQRPAGMTVFEFVIISSLRAAQLMRGCTPRVLGDHKRIVIAQLEVAGGFVVARPVTPSLQAQSTGKRPHTPLYSAAAAIAQASPRSDNRPPIWAWLARGRLFRAGPAPVRRCPEGRTTYPYVRV